MNKKTHYVVISKSFMDIALNGGGPSVQSVFSTILYIADSENEAFEFINELLKKHWLRMIEDYGIGYDGIMESIMKYRNDLDVITLERPY